MRMRNVRRAGNEWHGRLIRARNELEVLLIPHTRARGWSRRATRNRARRSHVEIEAWRLYWIFRRENSSHADRGEERKKAPSIAAKRRPVEESPQLKVIKLIGPRDNQANYRYQSTIASRRYVLPVRLHPHGDFFTRMTNPINYRAMEPTLWN